MTRNPQNGARPAPHAWAAKERQPHAPGPWARLQSPMEIQNCSGD